MDYELKKSSLELLQKHLISTLLRHFSGFKFGENCELQVKRDLKHYSKEITNIAPINCELFSLLDELLFKKEETLLELFFNPAVNALSTSSKSSIIKILSCRQKEFDFNLINFF